MARPPPSMYARRMAKLSASIFGDLTRKTDTKSMRVVKIFKENPRYKQNEWVNYYPNHQYATEILDGLRKYGLYRFVWLYVLIYAKEKLVWFPT